MNFPNNIVRANMNANQMKSISLMRQKGFSLFITLIALLVISLSAVALIRSVDTNTVIAGNLAFKQTATTSADSVVETAITWLQANNNGTTLNNTAVALGYSASVTNSAADPQGVAYWDSISAGACLMATGGGCVSGSGTPLQDAAGNTGEYIIQRLCANTGAASGADCIVSAGAVGSSGASLDPNNPISVVVQTQVYYRILVKVTGVRNAASYVQVIVSL